LLEAFEVSEMLSVATTCNSPSRLVIRQPPPLIRRRHVSVQLEQAVARKVLRPTTAEAEAEQVKRDRAEGVNLRIPDLGALGEGS
jgi:hypothetical protein